MYLIVVCFVVLRVQAVHCWKLVVALAGHQQIHQQANKDAGSHADALHVF